MTIKNVIDYVDRVKKNEFTTEEKMRWINEIEGYVQIQIMLLAQPECISYCYSSESEQSGISFPADNQMRLPRKLKAHVGGFIKIEGLVTYPENNLSDLAILSISDNGKLIEFEQGTFPQTGETPESAIAQIAFDGQDTELLVPAPFERLYYEYVLAKISENLEENSAQNNRLATFDETWQNFAEWYANTYKPGDGKAVFKGYYIAGKQGAPGPMGPPGENMFTVTLTSSGNTVTADKSYEEIASALADGKSAILVIDGQASAVNALQGNGVITFYEVYLQTDLTPGVKMTAVKSSNEWEMQAFDIAKHSQLIEAQDLIDNTKQDKLIAGKNINIAEDGRTISATSDMDDVIGYFRVTLTERGDGLYTGSKTFAQVKAEIESNKRFMFIDGYDSVLIVTRVGNAIIEFAGMSDGTDGWLWVGVASDDRWEIVPEVRVTLDWYNRLADDIGNTLNLTTADKSNLVAAINEVKQAADAKANAADLAPVATSGSYSDLSDQPTIPSVPTATIQANAAARHEHSNKTVLDLISETVKATWDAASTWVTTNGTNVLSHLSDSIKHITTAERTAWNAKQDKLIAGDNITIAADGKTISATGGGGGVSGDNIETVEAQQIEIPSKLSDFENDSGFATNSAVEAALADKQDKISDLESIRSGAGKGVTALQAVPSTYRTASAQDVIDNGLSDRISAIEEKETGWNGKYSKPTGGIPKTDLAQAVQTSLSKADSALQSHQSLAAYRTASAQDSIDSGKVDKVVGKGLSTNDYTNAAKAKVDAIPANPKYTDTVYDDTAVKGRVSALESKLNGNGAVTFSAVTTDSLTTEGEVEIYGTQPHIDFHYNNSSDDYTSRIIETANKQLNLSATNGVKINGKKTENETVTLTANADRITNVAYTAKYNELLGAVFVRIYGTINYAMSVGYDYDLFTINSRLPDSNAALSIKCNKNAMAVAKTNGVISIRPLESGINGYDVYITGFWFV